jgi:hypothetical protein
MPPGVTIVQEADAVVNYIKGNPDKRDVAAAALVVAGLVFTSNGGTERSLPAALTPPTALTPAPAQSAVDTGGNPY